MSNVIEISHLIKKFSRPEILALDDISLSLEKGRVIGLIGPDGSGKTTLIRIMIGLLKPSSGKISVLQLSPEKQTKLLHQKIGYMPQKFGLYEDLTVLENMNLYADLQGLSEECKKTQFEKMLKFTGLAPYVHRLAGRLSGGMKQKLGLGCALFGSPQVLFLDEPSVGVDPISRRELMKMIYDLKADGITVIWSTSYLDEAENFDDVILLNEGKVIFYGHPQKLTSIVKNRVFLTGDASKSPRAVLRELIKSNAPLSDGVISGKNVRLVLRKNQQIHEVKLSPANPRFEDAVIDILGGMNMQISAIADQIQTDYSGESVICADNLTKKYGDFTAANHISFNIKKGEIFGLLGPNGAGKSTTFKMLCGLIKPTSGKGFILDADMIKDPEKARAHIGYMAQKFSLFSTLSVRQNLNFFAGVYGLKGSYKQQRIDQMIEVFELAKHLNQAAGDLPLGFKQRLALSCAIMHNPAILFLDEPTSGVDPLTRREFWNHINTMVDTGVTVMVTTHFMDEAEYCDRIALIYEGHAIKIGAPDELKTANETMEDAFIRLIEHYAKEKVHEDH